MAESRQGSGVISILEFYTLKEFMSRMGLTETAMRALRRRGLKVARVGKRAFIPGLFAIAFLIEEGLDDDESKSSESTFEVLGASLGMPSNRGEQTEVSQD